jgi:bifunctional oligoribonuclease and PAP phosphatase NrnA
LTDLSSYNFESINGLFGKGKLNIVIFTHRNPDGDAIGSSLALYNLFIKMGNKVDVVVPNKVPAFLKWMKDCDKIHIASGQVKKIEELIADASLIFAIDFNDFTRIDSFGEYINKSKAYKVLIDHHPDPDPLADLIISQTSVSSTAELIFYFIKALKLSKFIDKEIAECIYCGIMTDTGCFSFNSSRTETFQTVGALLDLGIDKDRIYDLVYDNFSYSRMKLLGYCLNEKMVYLKEYNTAYISLSQKELRKYNFRIGDSEGFVNMPLSIDGVMLSALFIENKDRIKVSLRSKGNFAVNKIASKYFHGGGHEKASGGESYESLEKTVDNFVNLLPKLKDEFHNT